MTNDLTSTALVLVHGWAGSAQSWTPVVDLLVERGHRSVIAVALPGSPGYAGSAAPTIPSAADDLVRIIADQDGPVVLIGHSMGAQPTLLAHRAVPDQVLGEVVIDPAYGADDGSRHSMAEWADRIERSGHAEVLEFFRSATRHRLPEADFERVMSDLSRTPSGVIADYLRSEYVDDAAIGLMSATASAACGRVRPVLTIHSTAAGASRTRDLPAPRGSRTDVWPASGHYLHLEQPARFATTLLAWVESLRRVASVPPEPVQATG